MSGSGEVASGDSGTGESCFRSAYAVRSTCSSSWTDAAHAYHNSYAPSSSSWTCDSLLGAPSRADVCGDEPGAWAPALNGTLAEWVRLEFFDAPVYAQRLEVWEVNAAPFITRVVWEAEDGAMRLGWEGDDATACPGVFVLDDDTRARSPPFRVAAVWVHTSAPGWEEIDAARLTAEASCAPSPPAPPASPPPPAPPPRPPAAPPPAPPAAPPLGLSAAAAASIHVPLTVLAILLLWYLVLAACRRDLLFPCRPCCRKRAVAPDEKPAAPPSFAPRPPAPPVPLAYAPAAAPPQPPPATTTRRVVLPPLTARSDLSLATAINAHTAASVYDADTPWVTEAAWRQPATSVMLP